MPGPTPKPPELRRRRNKTATAALLKSTSTLIIPALPVQNAHPMTVAFWSDIWASPMVPEYAQPDVDRLVMLITLVEDFARADAPTQRIELSREIRLVAAEFGLSPISRRRLQWTIAKVAEAQDRSTARPARRRRPDPRLKEQ